MHVVNSLFCHMQMVVLVACLVACLVAWAACQVAPVECQTWAVLQALGVLVDPLLRRSINCSA